MKYIDDVISLAVGIAAGVGIYLALDGAHWSVPLIGGVFVAICFRAAALRHRATQNQAERR